jgi:hypothetical protein
MIKFAFLLIVFKQIIMRGFKKNPPGGNQHEHQTAEELNPYGNRETYQTVLLATIS